VTTLDNPPSVPHSHDFDSTSHLLRMVRSLPLIFPLGSPSALAVSCLPDLRLPRHPPGKEPLVIRFSHCGLLLKGNCYNPTPTFLPRAFLPVFQGISRNFSKTAFPHFTRVIIIRTHGPRRKPPALVGPSRSLPASTEPFRAVPKKGIRKAETPRAAAHSFPSLQDKETPCPEFHRPP